MKRYRSITPENAHEIPAGARVRFFYGAGHGEDLGTVTGTKTTRWGTELTARTDDGDQKTVSGISSIGIGVYLVDPAAQAKFLGGV